MRTLERLISRAPTIQISNGIQIDTFRACFTEVSENDSPSCCVCKLPAPLIGSAQTTSRANKWIALRSRPLQYLFAVLGLHVVLFTGVTEVNSTFACVCG